MKQTVCSIAAVLSASAHNETPGGVQSLSVYYWAMEEPSVSDTSDSAFLSSQSSSSLDVKQLIDANNPHSLLLESFSCTSLSSSASVIPPAFPLSTSPRCNIISLGEHLKMFPAIPSETEEQSGHCMDAPVVLTCPTSPRLRSMFKECLSITKWAVCRTPKVFQYS